MPEIKKPKPNKYRTNYKANRNHDIYVEHVINNKSFNQLGREYGISPQAVHSIVKRHGKKLDKLGGVEQ